MSRKKNIKSIAIFISILFVFLFAGSILLSHFIEKKIDDIYVSGYHLTSEDVSVNLFLRSVKIENTMITDSVAGKTHLQIPELQINGISYFNWLFKRKFKINKMKLLKPELFYSNHEDTTTLQNNTSNSLKLIINKIEITDAHITILSSDSEDTLMNSLLDITLWKLSFGDSLGKFQYKEFGLDRVAFTIQEAVYQLPNKLYRMQIGNAKFDTNDSLFTLKKLELVTNYSQYGIGEFTKTQQSWLHLTFSDLAINQIDLHRLTAYTTMRFNSLKIGYFNALAFKDRRLPFPEKPDNKLPMAIIDKLPFKLHCDSMNIADGHIEYTDRAPNSTDEGKFFFDDVRVHAENLSNSMDLIYGKTTMHATAKVMGQTLLEADFLFPNVRYQQPYTASGHLNPVSFKYFNGILLQSASAKLNDGKLKKLWFNFTYDNDASNGSMIFEYEGLDIALIDRKEMDKKELPSFFANAIIKTDNVRGKKDFKEGKISFERDKKKDIFNYWWKSLMSGLVSTVGPG